MVTIYINVYYVRINVNVQAYNISYNFLYLLCHLTYVLVSYDTHKLGVKRFSLC